MRTLAHAARLLSECRSPAAAAPLLEWIGFGRTIASVPPEMLVKLDLPANVEDPHIARGRGALRALSFFDRSDHRDTLPRVAARLASRSPQLLWLLAAIDPDAASVTLAVFDSSSSRPKTAALSVLMDAVVDSDSETVRALAAASSDADVLTHCRWLEILGRDSISRRFFRQLEGTVLALSESLEPAPEPDDAFQLALLSVSRLLFLSFMETKGWLDGDHGFLANRFADCMLSGGRYHQRVLNPLFFGTLNTNPSRRAARAREFGRIPFLNGGLFSKSPLEIRTGVSRFPDDTLGDLFGNLLTRYRFTAREDGTVWSEAAIDPEMLGKAFESLMSSRDRKRSGSFYTPHSLVREVCRSAIAYGLASDKAHSDTVREVCDGAIPGHDVRDAILHSADSARVLDPACGSGAFLVHVLEEISSIRMRLGDLRRPHTIRRDVLTRSIFGVDVNPVAVWLCELRLWLSVAIEDPETDPLRVAPLPNLDRNIRIGDSLHGEGFTERFRYRGSSRVESIRRRYARATGPRKRALGKAIDSLERECAIDVCERRIRRLTSERRDLLLTLRTRDLFGARHYPGTEARGRLRKLRQEILSAKREMRRLKDGKALPFSFSTGFADVCAAGGFNVVVGNPPWIRTHNIDARERSRLRETYFVYSSASWRSGTKSAGAGSAFASQVDAAALFVERSMDLLKPDGTLALIVPAKLWRSLAGGGVRHLIQSRLDLREMHDLSSARQMFEAAVYPSIIVATKHSAGPSQPNVRCVVQRGVTSASWRQVQAAIAFDDTPGSPWVIAPPEVREAFETLRRAGLSLSRSHIGRPLLGVKTGCNDAYIVDVESGLDPSCLRPALRGEQIRQWTVPAGTHRILWTHDSAGAVRSLSPESLKHLSRWRTQLEGRADARGRRRWWSLFRTESADSSLPRVVWADIGKEIRAAVIPEGDNSVPLNSCYVVRCRDHEDALTLAAILNCRLASQWIALLAEPARGGYVRYMGWVMSLLPLPRDWQTARALLAPLAGAACSGESTETHTMLLAVLDAYGIRRRAVEPLLRWNA